MLDRLVSPLLVGRVSRPVTSGRASRPIDEFVGRGRSPILRALTLVILCCLATSLTAQDIDIAELEEQAINAAVARVAPSVVRIETVGGLDRIGEVLLGDGPTTGLVVSAEGFIISSAFNFIRQPASILITLPSGMRAPAKIVARDHSRMLVLLKVDTNEQLTVPTPVPIDDMQVGQWAIAVGRTFDAKQPNLSVGIVSAKDRVWGKAIQCDTKISPSNYGGPLVDIEGRVFGVLVPMSPNETSDIAGAEWYDSGIGFAVPLVDVNRAIQTMMQGKDVHAGLLGIALRGGSIYSLPAELAACQVKSPAYEAGLRAGDTIVEIDGLPIERQAHLKHALGKHYAGETVNVVVRRDDKRIAADIELVEKLVPYDRPFLGILPRRDEQQIVVRYVYPESGAANAGLAVGDRIVRLDEIDVADTEALTQAIVNLEPDNKVQVIVKRDDESKTLEVTLGTTPTTIPSELPESHKQQATEGEVAAEALIDIKVPEQPNECFALVPRSYQADVPHGVVVYLRPPGDLNKDELLARWQNVCEANDLILLAPQPLDQKRWTPVEVEFVKKTVDQVATKYNVDRSRVVAYGKEAGGALAYLFALRNRETVRAVVAVDAALPSRLRLPATDPVYPLAILTTQSPKSKLAEQVTATIKRMQEMKYPVTVLPMDTPRSLNEAELSSAGRWIDTLDRI